MTPGAGVTNYNQGVTYTKSQQAGSGDTGGTGTAWGWGGLCCPGASVSKPDSQASGLMVGEIHQIFPV